MTSVVEALQMARQALDAGDRSLAVDIYAQIQQSAPGEPKSLLALAQLAQQAGDTATLDECARRAAAASAAHANNPAVHNALATIEMLRGRFDAAVESARRAVEFAADSPELQNNLGAALSRAGEVDLALASFRESADLKPNATAYHNLGKLYFKQDELSLAEENFRQALALTPDHYEARVYLGVILAQAHAVEAAEQEFRRGIAIKPDNHEAYNNLAAVLQPQGRLDEAVECFDAALRYCPDSAEAHFNRACIELMRGNYDRGLPGYEWRMRTGIDAPPELPIPRWQGQPLDDRRLLLLFEQGLGDGIQLVRYASLLKQQHPRSTIIARCLPGWQRLLTSVDGIDEFALGSLEEIEADYYLLTASLPLLMRTTPRTIPARVPYLFAEPAVVERWRAELSANGKFKVGIAWQGNPKYSSDFYRSIPLARFAPLAACDGVKLFSLQKNFGHEQLAEFAERWNIADLGARLDHGADAMIDTAAVMTCLDLVITSDTSIAHLAGALGVPVWVALPLVPDWRWQLDRADSPWYPTMRLFRQSKFRQWDDVFVRIGQALETLAAKNTATSKRSAS